MQWPRVISRGIIVDDPISHIDIFPTMLGATKAGGFDSSNLKNHLFDSSLKHLVSNIDGVNLLPFIAKTKTNLSMNVDVENNEKPHKSLYFRSGHYSAIRVGDWKLQVCGNPNKMWLFNLKDDPSEMKNLAQVPEFSFKLQEMLQYLDEVSKDQSKPLWPSMTETAVHIDKLFEFNESLDDEYIYWPN